MKIFIITFTGAKPDDNNTGFVFGTKYWAATTYAKACEKAVRGYWDGYIAEWWYHDFFRQEAPPICVQPEEVDTKWLTGDGYDFDFVPDENYMPYQKNATDEYIFDALMEFGDGHMDDGFFRVDEVEVSQ